MKRSPALALVICTALGATILSSGVVRADDDDDANASALVKLVPLQQGSLPTVITAYGQVQPSAKAQESIAAPLAVRVGNVMVRTGEAIAKGTPMVTLIPSPESRAAYQQAQLAARISSQLLERSQALVKGHLQTAADLAQAQKAAAEAKSQLSVLEEEGAAGPTTIKAPYDAIVLKVDEGPGSVVAQGAPIIEIARPNGLVLNVGVLPAQAISVKAGNKVNVTPIGSSNSFDGKVLLRGEVVSADNGLVPIEISVPPGKVLTGEMAQAVITTGEVHGYLVPHDAVLADDKGEPYIVQAVKMAAKKVSVQVLGSQADEDVVAGKLIAGAPVVVAGSYQVDNGTKLRVADAKGDAKGSDASQKDGK